MFKAVVPLFVKINIARLRDTRSMFNASRKNFAEFLHIDKFKIAYWETGGFCITRREYNAIASVIGWEAWC